MIARGLVVWLVMLTLAVANGALREAVLSPFLGAQAGHVVSTLLLSAAVVAVAWLTIGWIDPPSARAAVVLGCLWVVLTVAFEFGFGRLVGHKEWSQLLADYDLFHGRIWPIVLVTLAGAPLVTARVRLRV